jgi:hypothetical protein
MQVLARLLAFCKRMMRVCASREVMAGAGDGWVRQTPDFHAFDVEDWYCSTANFRDAADSKTSLGFLARGRNFAWRFRR